MTFLRVIVEEWVGHPIK